MYSPKILILNDTDRGGGGAKVAFELFRFLKNKGYTCAMVVGSKKTQEPGIFEIPKYFGVWQKAIGKILHISIQLEPKMKGFWKISKFLRHAQNPIRELENFMGWENFYQPNSKKFLSLIPFVPDIIHLHNLHGRYFDIRILPKLGKKFKLVASLLDSWWFAGHCVHPLECERWITGCGNCPHLDIFQKLEHDGTKHNWKLKQKLFSNTPIYWIGLSQWVLDKLYISMAAPSILKATKIFTGINLNQFQPNNKIEVRKKLNLPENSFIVIFAASTIKQNPWKDYPTMEKAMIILDTFALSRPVYFLALGEENNSLNFNQCEIHFKPYITDPKLMPMYYQAADVYLHGARADTFPTAVLESLACGTPVIGTNICGIPEEIKGYEDFESSEKVTGNSYSQSECTGILIPKENAHDMAKALYTMIENPKLVEQMGINARMDTEVRFDEETQMNQVIEIYQEIIKSTNLS